MFLVHEMMGNFSKVVERFSTESEANDYVMDTATDNAVNVLGGNDFEEYEDELQNQISYFSIEDDGRELIDDVQLAEMYDDMLDECYPEMFGMSASFILYHADNIQYSCGLNDFYDSIRDSYYCEEME